ncbi:MAG: glycosyltransferase [Puniceicoccales bacterium]|nr:glycosyltransferase [Puniceicoccales bacterium]
MSVLNGGQALVRALDSVRGQSFEDYEFIIVNDGSTDATAAILAEHAQRDSRIRLIHHERNVGLAASLNEGIAAARADLILRADADDFNFPERFAKQVAFMEANPTVDVLGGAMERLNTAGVVFSITRQPETDREIKAKMYRRVPFFHPTVAMRKTFWQKNCGYDPRWKRCEDFDLWIRGYKSARYHNLPDVLVRYQAPRELKTQNLQEVFRMIFANARRHGDWLKPLLAIAKFSIATFYFRLRKGGSKYFSND